MRYLCEILAVIAVIAAWEQGFAAAPSVQREPAQPVSAPGHATTTTSPEERAKNTAADESAIKELGVKEGKKIETGFIFIDGRYVDAPYVVSRRGRNVYVNDILVEQWRRWPLVPLRVEKDPGSPAAVYADAKNLGDISNPKDIEFTQHYQKRVYLYQHFQEKVARQKMIDYWREMPFIESVEPIPESGEVCIKEKNIDLGGVSLGVPIGPPRPGGIFNNKDDLRAFLDEHRDRCERAIEEGGTVFIFCHSADKEMDRAQTAHDLAVIVEILLSSRSEEEKIGLLDRIGFAHRRFGGGAWCRLLIKQFQGTPQLGERIAALAQETGIQPRTLKDIPEKSPAGIPPDASKAPAPKNP